jgi:hypothetical protein
MCNPDTGTARASGPADISQNKMGSADFDLRTANTRAISSCEFVPDARSFGKSA